MTHKHKHHHSKTKKEKKLTQGLIPENKLAFWIKNNLNVLMEGEHGVGKTSIILDAWNKAKLKWAYFSGATMDPFIDFVGVPVKVQTKDGTMIELIRPKHMAKGDIQAIFIDEFNRTHKKVRNAVMELLQFKTINGTPISKDLRVVWAAVNPDNAEGENDYDTDHLDPAQRDRFQVFIKIPYVCDLNFFTKKYGEKMARAAIQYWNSLEPKIQRQVSPRRLDYALSLYQKGGDLYDVIPLEASPKKLYEMLKGRSLDSMVGKKPEEIKEFFNDEANYELFSDSMMQNKKYQYMLQYLKPEKISALLGGRRYKNQARKIIISLVKTKEGAAQLIPVLTEISLANQQRSVVKFCQFVLQKLKAKPAKPPKPTAVKVPTAKTSAAEFIRQVLSTPGIDASTLSNNIEKARGKMISATKFAKLKVAAERWAKKFGYTLSTQNGVFVFQGVQP